MASQSSWRSISSWALLAVSSLAPSLAAAAVPMAAWNTDIGPQLMVYNATTGTIHYSLCNSYATPVFPYDESNIFSLDTKPRNGTAVAGTGWYTPSTGRTTASVFYQADNGQLINAWYTCDPDTGKFLKNGSQPISEGAPSVHNTTGLASIVLSDTDGYRVFYHDADKAVNVITYTNTDGWNYGGYVSQDPASSFAVHMSFTSNNGKSPFNISLFTPHDNTNIEVSRYNQDKTWHIQGFPHPLSGIISTSNDSASTFSINTTAKINFTLPAWDGNTQGIGASVDKSNTRSVFYIGTDKTLYKLVSKNFVWSVDANQSSLLWPQADEPNAPLAAAYDTPSSSVYLYYMVKGVITQAYYDGDAWRQAVAIPSINTTLTNPSPSSSSTAPTNTAPAATTSASGGGDSGLSAGAKAGVGVGVALGAVGLAILGAIIFFARRRKARADAAAAAPTEPDPNHPAAPGGAQYYDYASSPPYGSPPPPSSTTPGSAYAWDKKDQGAYAPAYAQGQPPQMLEAVSHPQELDAPRVFYELPEQHYSHELVGDSRPEQQAVSPEQHVVSPEQPVAPHHAPAQ